MASSSPASGPEAPPSDFAWMEFDSSGRGHLIEKEGSTRPVAEGGEVVVKVMTLCGNVAAEDADTVDFREFKGFDGHRNINWCAMCKHLYKQRNGEGGMFGP